MAPTERTPKRQKLSPAEIPLPGTSPDQTPSTPENWQDKASPNETSNRSSWYSRTWPRKAAPITQVARESISSASNTAIETANVLKDKVGSTGNPSRRSSLALTLGKRTSNKALPVSATTTTDHAMPQSRKSSKQETSEVLPATNRTPSSNDTGSSAQEPRLGPDKTLQPVQEATPDGQVSVPASDIAKQIDAKQEIVAPRSWIGWLARADDGSAKSMSSATEPQPKTDEIPLPTKPAEDTINDSASAAPETNKPLDLLPPTNPRRSWLPIWSNSTAAQSAPTIASPAQDTSSQTTQAQLPLEPPLQATDSVKPTKPTSLKEGERPLEVSTAASDPQASSKPSAWIFWSRDKPSETTSLKDVPREGEIAVANTETESHPRRASVTTDNTNKSKASITKSVEDPLPKPESKKKHESKASEDSTKQDSKRDFKTTKAQSKGASATAVAPSEVEASRTASPAPPRKSYDHLLLPSFHATLKLPESPTFLQQLSRLFYSTKDPELKHLTLIKDPPRIKNALVIGVHGYFPAPLIRSVLGQPTGTSIKFADMAAKSIQRWTKKRGYDCHVKTAALEGEGKIAERIDLLWKLLLNWIDEIRKSDFIMVACHSQGVPVATMLVAKLIHFGCINAARVGICAMAGVNLGPFPEFKSRWISGSAGELFEFSDPASKVSTDYLAAVEDVLKFGVKLTYVGSIDDQLVSLDSAIMAPVSHPHIYRAVSIDSRLHAPDFVSHLVAFALKLRNLGVQDHGLIKELSAPLAGSLYSGEGHSRLYEDGAIYDLAVHFALETSSMTGVPLSQKPTASSGSNPYILPFAMRGLLEEDFVKSDLQDEVSQLLQQFDDWKPTTKALKDVKFRLEGIRSKL